MPAVTLDALVAAGARASHGERLRSCGAGDPSIISASRRRIASNPACCSKAAFDPSFPCNRRSVRHHHLLRRRPRRVDLIARANNCVDDPGRRPRPERGRSRAEARAPARIPGRELYERLVADLSMGRRGSDRRLRPAESTARRAARFQKQASGYFGATRQSVNACF